MRNAGSDRAIFFIIIQKLFVFGGQADYSMVEVLIMRPNIVIFGTPTCGWCKKAKDYFRSSGYNFKYIDVSQDASALRDMVRKTGQQGVPQIWINNVAVVGFDKAKIEGLLK